MKLTQTRIPDVVIVEPTVFADERGWFMETFNESRFHAGLRELGLPVARPFVQDNHSHSRRGVLRGLHYQIEQAQSAEATARKLGVELQDTFEFHLELSSNLPTIVMQAKTGFGHITTSKPLKNNRASIEIV